MTRQPIARYLDHAVLKPSFTRADAEREIRVGLEHNVRTVCVRPCDLELTVALCRNTNTLPGAVLAFPHGTHLPASKADEARRYVELGAREIDMVANYAFIRSELWDAVLEDLQAVTAVTRPAGVKLKVILETSELELPHVARATELALAAGADWVKTSTGFASGGATVEAVQTMLAAANGRIEVKASGGIRDLATAERFLAMGCTRLGVGSTTTPVLCGGKPSENPNAY